MCVTNYESPMNMYYGILVGDNIAIDYGTSIWNNRST